MFVKSSYVFAVIAVIAMAFVVGCSSTTSGSGSGGSTSGTSSSTSSTSSNTPAVTGHFQGVYGFYSGTGSNASGTDSGTVQLTISSTGAITGTSSDTAGGSPSSFTGTLTGHTLSLSMGGSSPTTGTLTVKNSGAAWTAAVTNSSGQAGLLAAGTVPTSSTLAGSYTGTIALGNNNGGPSSATVTAFSVGSTGAVSDSVTFSMGGSPITMTMAGYVDSSGNLYVAYSPPNGGSGAAQYQMSTGASSLTGSAYTASLVELGDGTTLGFSLTKS